VEDDSEKKKLRVVDDEGPTEEVMRLGRGGKQAKSVERVPIQPEPEEPSRLKREGVVDDFDRRSVEPDIDTILGVDDNLEEADWMDRKEAKSVPYGWFALIILIIGGLVGTSAVMLMTSSGGDGEVAKIVAVEHLADDQEDDAEATALVESIESNLSRYVAAKSVDELLPLVRDPERVKPLMEAWHSRHPIEPSKFDGLGVFQPLDLEGRLFWLITCLVEGDRPQTILMEQTEDGRVFVDWETQVCYQPMEWDEYADERPSGVSLDFRVYAEPDRNGFYSHEFSDEDRWNVYRLTAKDSQEPLFGYAERGSELDEKLMELCRANRGYRTALFLRLKIPEGTQSPRGVLIEELLSERWAVVEPLKGEDAP
jgi:hypothetical protein